MTRLAVHNGDPDHGFKKLSKTKDYEDYRAKFVLFEVLRHGGTLFFYFHSWYQRYGNALIVTYISKSLSDTCKIINVLGWDYSKKERDQIVYEPEDISELYQADDFCDQIKSALVGKNVMITYRKMFVKDFPIFAINFETYKSDSLIIVKPGIYLPKNLLPKALLRTETPKKSLKDILGRGRKPEPTKEPEEPEELDETDIEFRRISENI